MMSTYYILFLSNFLKVQIMKHWAVDVKEF